MSVKAINLLRFGYLSFMAIWIVGELVTLVFLGLSNNLSMYHCGGHIYLSDFIHFYMAGKIALSPARDLFYSWDLQKHFLEGIIPGPLPSTDFYTPFLPIVFLVMVPYSLLSINYAHLLFDFVNLCLGLSGCFMVIHYFNWTGNRMTWWVLVGTLASLPCAMTWLLGQISWLYVGLICFFLVFMLKKQNIPASLALFLTIVKPQYALFLIIPAFCLKRYRLLFYSVGWGILFLLLCAYIFSWKALITYPLVINEYELLRIRTAAMYSVRPFFELFLSQQKAYYCCLGALILAFCSLTFMAVFRLPGRMERGSLFWLVSVSVLASVLFSPHTFSHDVMLLAIPALLTLPAAALEHQSIYTTVWRFIFYLLPVISWMCFILAFLHLAGNFIFTGIVLMLFICGLGQLCTQSAPTPLTT
jgi:hypothetical protein